MSGHDHQHHKSYENVSFVFYLNLAFTVVEIVGGLLTNSVAILSDALHDLGDTLSLAISWYLERVARRGRDGTFSFGYRRFSLLGALLNGFILIMGAIVVLSQAIPRIFEPQSVHSQGMFWLAIVGLLVNGIAALKLRHGKTINESMLAIHMLEDLLGWAAILLVSIAIYFFDAPILDPILSIMFTAFVVYQTLKRLKKTLFIFLQSIPPDIDVKHINHSIKEIEGVCDVHDTHVWTLDGESHVLTTHVVYPKDYSLSEIRVLKIRVKECISRLGLMHATLELEQNGDVCELSDC